MKRLFVGISGSLLLMLLMAAYAAGQATKTFSGELTDEHLNCVQSPMKTAPGLGDNKAACVLYWAHSQEPKSKYVLYDAATKKTFQLDDQTRAEPFVGAKVVVTGTESGGTIKVTDIQVDEKAYKTGGQGN